jgi:putative transposase
MPRLARFDASGVLHHVMGRGIERKEIFFSDADRSDFLDRLAGLVEEGALDVYAWVLMPNQFHLLCKTRNRPLPSSMRKILTGYVVNLNRRHCRYGHLFQNRYKSIVCQEDRYLKELVRYIHLNLLRAGLVKDMAELSRNPWSGDSALMGKIKREWQYKEYGDVRAESAYHMELFGALPQGWATESDGAVKRKHFNMAITLGLECCF